MSLTLVAVVIALAPVSAFPAMVAHGQAQDPAPARPAERTQEATPTTNATSATVASLAGKWTMDVDTSVGARPFWLEIKTDPKDAKKLTGTIDTLVRSDAIEGEVVDGKLRFWFRSTIDAVGNTVLITFVGTVQKDGSLAGTLDPGKGNAMPWTAVRDKQ